MLYAIGGIRRSQGHCKDFEVLNVRNVKHVLDEDGILGGADAWVILPIDDSKYPSFYSGIRMAWTCAAHELQGLKLERYNNTQALGAPDSTSTTAAPTSILDFPSAADEFYFKRKRRLDTSWCGRSVGRSLHQG